jgi:hypothetical protein
MKIDRCGLVLKTGRGIGVKIPQSIAELVDSMPHSYSQCIDEFKFLLITRYCDDLAQLKIQQGV